MGYFRRKLRRGVCLAEKRRAAPEVPEPLRRWVTLSPSPPPLRPRRYVRLAVHRLHEESYQLTGLFAAAYEVIESGRLTDGQLAEFDAVLDWFRENLTIPQSVTSSRAIFWFKSSAGDCVRMIWRLANLLRPHDLDVRMMAAADPGNVVYEDEHQVAAVSRRRL